MTATYDRLIARLESALEAAEMTRMGLGFPNDRIEIKSIHFGDERKGQVGDVLHPDDYVKRITKLYRQSWIIGPLKESIAMVQAQRELIDRVEKLAKALDMAELAELAKMARGDRL